jgi:hypothetical protein
MASRAVQRGLQLAVLLAVAQMLACATPQAGAGESSTAALPAEPPPAPPPSVRVVFRNGKVYAREGDREWPIAEVSRDEMLWAPDGFRFAYIKLREPPATQPASLPASAPVKRPVRRSRKGRTQKPPPDRYHIVIRNIRGDPVNEFPVYRPGRPSQLDWITNDTLGYLAPRDKTGNAYVLHSASTGEIVQVFRGTRFIWSPGRRQLAYIVDRNRKRDQLVKVNDQVVWPRASSPALPRPPKQKRRRGRWKPHRRVLGELVWSPDGNGLAFIAKEVTQIKLVVLLVVHDESGDLTWPLPDRAVQPGNRLFWGESKVVIGASMLKPRFAASWTRLR